MDSPQRDDDGFTLVQKKRTTKQAPIQKPQKLSPNKFYPSKPAPEIDPEDWFEIVFRNTFLVKFYRQGFDDNYSTNDHDGYSIPVVLQCTSVGNDTVTAKPQNHDQLVKLEKIVNIPFDYDSYTDFHFQNNEITFYYALYRLSCYFEDRCAFNEPILVADCFIKHAKCGDGFSDQFSKFHIYGVENGKFRGTIDDHFWFVALACMKESYKAVAGRVLHKHCKFGVVCRDFRAKHLVEFSH